MTDETAAAGQQPSIAVTTADWRSDSAGLLLAAEMGVISVTPAIGGRSEASAPFLAGRRQMPGPLHKDIPPTGSSARDG